MEIEITLHQASWTVPVGDAGVHTDLSLRFGPARSAYLFAQ